MTTVPDLAISDYYNIIVRKIQPTTVFATAIVILWTWMVRNFIRWSLRRGH